MIELRLYLQPPPQRTESLLTALQSLARLARLARGCLEVHLFTESQDPRNLCYTEAWDTEENLCLMLCSEHFTRLAELMETAVEPPVLDFRTITAIRGLEFAQQARQGQNEGAFTLGSGDDSYP
jgi:quinol monooxygenase YgiN